MLITDIYKKYKINQGLQEHMVRVAAVAQMICQHSSLAIDEQIAVSGCLLHDMGNLIKIPLDKSDANNFEPEGIAYWQEIQIEMKAQYGDVETATNEIIKDIPAAPAVAQVVAEAAFGKMWEIAESGSLEAKVLEYADMRVALLGITSAKERFADIRARYVPHRHTTEYIDNLETAAQKIETELFSSTDITPEDITDVSTRPLQVALWQWDIKTAD